jgi:hypothetical protein
MCLNPSLSAFPLLAVMVELVVLGPSAVSSSWLSFRTWSLLLRHAVLPKENIQHMSKWEFFSAHEVNMISLCFC